MKRRAAVGIAAVLAIGGMAVLAFGCKKTWEGKESQKEWSRGELKALVGKTRDEIKDVLGDPSGMYTFDTKGRWHFPHVLVREEGEPQAQRMSVLVYFSAFGDHRVTIVEVLDRWEKAPE